MSSLKVLHTVNPPEHVQSIVQSSPPADGGVQSRVLLRKVLIGILAAVFVLTALTLVADARDLAHEFSQFTWWLALPIVMLTLWNYAIRFQKWEIFLSELGVSGLSRGRSLRIYLSGFAMSVTPGKVGEFIKAVYVRRETGSPANRIAAVITAERATDGAAMAILALFGATRYSYGREFVLAIIATGLAILFIVQRPVILHRLIGRFRRFEFVDRSAHHISAFIEASSTILSPRLLAKTVSMSVLSWSGECVAFYLVLIGLGLASSFELLLLATFILAVSSLAGGISLLPGGLGVADASVAGMLVLLVHDDAMTTSVAVAATLIIRFATLWFAVLIGAIALLTIERDHRLCRTAPPDSPAAATEAQVEPRRGL